MANTIKKNLVMNQGATFNEVMPAFRSANGDFSLSGYSGRATMRPHYYSETIVVLNVSLIDQDKTVTLSLPAANTAAIDPGIYVFDVEAYSGETVVRLIEGKIEVKPEANF